MKRDKKYYILICICILLIIILSCLIFMKLNNDGMSNSDIYNIKYRVYQNGKWTKYSRNGVTIGDKENPIQNIEFKYNNKKGYVYYNVFNKEWSEQQYGQMKDNYNKIYNLQINISNILYKKYVICYRTYNKKDKWLNWSCDEEISGNKKYPITAIEVKIIPKTSNKKDYLKDYIEPTYLDEELQGGQDEEIE